MISVTAKDMYCLY